MTDNAYKSDEMNEIPASELIDKIQKGESLEYDHFIIKGDIDIGMLNLQRDHEKLLVASSIKITNSRIEGCLESSNVIFKEFVDFNGTIFNQRIYFKDTQFNQSCLFSNTYFAEDTDFRNIQVIGYASFVGSTFCSAANFWSGHFNGDSDFSRAHFDGKMTSFSRIKFDGYADFRGAWFAHDIDFERTEIGIDITFKDAIFSSPKSQELACRIARRRLDEHGDRDEADYYFYHEMEAKRRQKPWYFRYTEYVFIQLVFGYGVHPFRLWSFWLGFVGIFTMIYWFGHGIDATASSLKEAPKIADYIWFSIATAVTPGYAGYVPTADFKLIAGLEAILGTFMWAAFITTFAKKYMR